MAGDRERKMGFYDDARSGTLEAVDEVPAWWKRARVAETDLECRALTHRRVADAVTGGGLEPEPPVVAGCPQQQNEWPAPRIDAVEELTHQSRSDSLALMSRTHPDRQRVPVCLR